MNKIQTASYDNVSGLLSSMSFADGANFAYSYDSKWRTVEETYNDGSISYTYDDSSKITQAVQTLSDNSTQNYSYTYGDYSYLPTQETLPDGWKLLRTMDPIGNLTSLTLKDNNGIVKYAVSYAYDANFQMSSLTANGKTISYTRNNNNAITNISLNNLANISYTYDNLGRLQSMSYNSNNNELLKNSYEIEVDENIASTTVSKNGEVYGQWRYTYENLSSGLKTANFYKSASSNELVDEYSSYTYAYDTAGNPYSESNDGIATTSYTSSLNNQTRGITRSSNLKYPIRGKKSASSSLAINGIPQNTTDETFCYGLPAYNVTPQYEEIKIEASQNSPTQKSMERGKVYLAESSESLTYSNSGNLTSDSRWVYTWNARQRLTSVETSTQAINAGVPKVKYVYSYNWKGLKTKSEKYTWNADSNTWELYSTNHRYYDEHNLIYERTEYAENVKDLYGQQMQPTYNKYYYALDLLNYLHGTGGTGGVRMVNINGTDAFTFNNIVGNIEALYDATTGETLLAEYEYAPFGEIRKQGGTLANANPLKFSSRYTENETGLSYYSYRHYSPSSKKWLSKDPIGENGGMNLYGFVANNPITRIDILGEWIVEKCTIQVFSGHGSYILEDEGAYVNNEIAKAAKIAADKGLSPACFAVGGTSCYDAISNLNAIYKSKVDSGKRIDYGYENPNRTDGLRHKWGISVDGVRTAFEKEIKKAKEHAIYNMCNKSPDCCNSVEIRLSVEKPMPFKYGQLFNALIDYYLLQSLYIDYNGKTQNVTCPEN